MKRFVLSSILLLLLTPIGLRADLESDIRAILNDKNLKRVETGIEIAKLNSSGKPTILFQHNAKKMFIPASNLKLVTTSAALEKLGADFRFRTILFLHDGDLIVLGSGDPTLGDAEMLKLVGWDVTTVFESWAQRLIDQKITTIRNVIVDDSIFDTEFLHPNWPTDQAHLRYVAQVGGINLNANCIDFMIHAGAYGSLVTYDLNPRTSYANIRNQCVTGSENAIWLSRTLGGNEIILKGQTPRSTAAPVSVTVHDPPMFAGTVLAETLKAKGISFTGEILRDRTTQQRYEQSRQSNPSSFRTIAVHETPLSTVLARANKDSMNLYAEALCKRLGFESTKSPGSWQNGTAAIGAFLTDLGIQPDEFQLDDGAGLSKQNRISPNAIVRVLAHNFAGDTKDDFLPSLAVAGIDGTLEDRFPNSDLRGRVMGKSGYVNMVRALSGYVQTKSGDWYAFSILMNGPDGGNAAMKPIQERIVKAVDENAK